MRGSRRRDVAAGVLAAVVVLTEGAAALPASGSEAPLLVRVGYTTFESMREGPSPLPSIERYLEGVRDASRSGGSFARPVDFDLYLGNYYQILAWLETGLLDAAIVSPVLLHFLGDDFVPLVELGEHDDETGGRGHYVTIEGAPAAAWSAHLEALLCAAGAGAPCPGRPIRRAGMVSHLSASGFLVPLVAAKSWLDERNPGLGVRDAFWDRFFGSARFALTHPGEYVDDVDFSFSYTGRPGRGDAGILTREVLVPDSVFVARRSLAGRIAGGAAAWIPRQDVVDAMRSTPGGYREVRVARAEIGRELGEIVDVLLEGNDALARRAELWFRSRKFDFTLPELFRFLRQDQKTSGIGALALVLPGGGVRAAYQARVLDALYESGMLANDCRSGALCVETIVGTSGGAITGLFAALRPAGVDRALTRHWVDGERVTVSGADLFPGLDILRWTSLLAAFLIFAFASHVVFATDRGARSLLEAGPIERTPAAPRSFQTRVLAVVFAGPLALGPLEGFGRSEHVLSLEGALYLLILLTAHLGVTSIAPSSARLERSGTRLERSLAAASAAAISGAIAWRVLGGAENPWRTISPGALFCVGLLAFLALVIVRGARRDGRSLEGAREYLAAAVVPAAVVAASFLGLGLLSRTGAFSMLELSGVYWIGVVTAAAVVSAATLVWATRPAGGRAARSLLGKLRFWETHHEVLLWRAKRIWTLAAVLAVGLVWWNWWLAPGLYGNRVAYDTFERKLGRHVGRETVAAAARLDLQTDLVVTATSMDPPEDLFLCFSGGGRCGGARVRAGQWFRLEPRARTVVDVVFASGAAFPVYPAHRVRAPELGERLLIDGGYGNNVPVEAAALAGARQVLIVHSGPDPELLAAKGPAALGFRLSGRLAESVIGMYNFLFERLQEENVHARSELVVAEIFPDARRGAGPYLTDFREATIRSVVAAAEEDLGEGRRIGQVRNWGLPGQPVARIGAAASPAER